MLTREDVHYIEKLLPFYKRLDASDQSLLSDKTIKESCRTGDILLGRERECSGVLVVKSGQVRAFLETEDGKEITLYRLLSDDICILSASCILKNITFDVTLEAEKDGEIYRIPARLWATLSDKYSPVKEFSSVLMAERFSEVMWVLEQIISKNMGQRTAAFLLEQSVLEETDRLTLTHETIAKNLGTAREVVSRVLKYFENEGVLKLSRGEIRITDIKKLRQISA